MESRSALQSRKMEETPHFPEEIIIEKIFPRLPVKSVLKFRCVAKSWCSLIGTKKFMKAHLKNSIKTSEFAHRRILFETTDGFSQCFVQSLFSKQFTDPITITADIGIDFNRKYVSLVGCCNGLVCILLEWKNFILWNPGTKKFRILPDFNIKMRSGLIIKCGFGFDELSDDYKVLGVLVESNVNAASVSYSGRVYSLRSNSWKDIEQPDVKLIDEAGVHVSGKLHWCRKCDIVSFDLNSCVYGVVELPSYATGDFKRLGVVGRCLSAQFSHPNWAFNIWIMKEYGVKESWDKVVTVPIYMYLDYSAFPTLLIPKPLVIGSNGEVLLKYGSSIVIYNPKFDMFKRPQMTGRGLFDGLKLVGVYVESLVSVES